MGEPPVSSAYMTLIDILVEAVVQEIGCEVRPKQHDAAVARVESQTRAALQTQGKVCVGYHR